MNFLGFYRHAQASHAKSLTGEMFVSLGMNAMSGRDLYAEGGLIALADGRIRNRSALVKALKLSEDAPMALIVNRAYRDWGADYVRRMEGGVMTAVIDRAEERMILSTDRMGAVPVFYAWRGRSAAFSSHPDLLLQSGVCGRGVDKCGMRELFFSGGVYTPGRTPFRDIRLLEPGCVLIADTRGTRIKRYHSIADTLSKEFLSANSVSPDREIREFLRGSFPGEQEAFINNDLAAFLEDSADFSNAPPDFFECLIECNRALGYPGRGAADAFLLHNMKKALEKENRLILGGMHLLNALPFEKDAGDYLKEDVRARLGAEDYRRDRFALIRDRFHLPLEQPGAEAFLERSVRFLYALASHLAVCRLFSMHLGAEAVCPLQDERVVLSLLTGEREQMHKESAGALPKEENAPDASEIYEACRMLITDSTQPVYPYLDASLVYEGIQNGELQPLSRLLSVNQWMNRYETELLFV